jgi:rod shape-determining protein MreC
VTPVTPGERTPGGGAAGGTARLMFYALVAISLMALDYRGGYVDRMRALAERAVEPLFWAVDLPFAGIDAVSERFRGQARLSQRVATLEAELGRARARLARLDDLRLENARLRSLLDTARRLDTEFIAAELAHVDLDPFAHRVLVRRGHHAGVRQGMPVIDDTAVLGQVDGVYRHFAQIILISDPDHALPVQILPGGERTIAYGSGSLDRLRLTDLPMNARMAPGDLVVTSGIGGRFPAGLPVARIEEVTRRPGRAFATATAAPLAAMDRNRVVLILREAMHSDASALDGNDASSEGAP